MSRPGRPVPLAFSGLLLVTVALIAGGAVCAQDEESQPQPTPEDAQIYHDAPSLIDWTPEQARAHPELRELQPAESQQELPEILRAVGVPVKTFFDDFPNVTCMEKVQSGRCIVGEECNMAFAAKFQYLLAGRDAEGARVMNEYRTDGKARPINKIEVGPAFDSAPYLTSGFASPPLLHFHPQNMMASRFRYFGRQIVGGKETDVVGFAEIPEEYCCPTKLGPKDHEVALFLQGLAWIDAATHQILRTQTDVLRPQPGLGLEKQVTRVDYGTVQLPETSTVFWLPTQAVVDIWLRLEIHHEVRHMHFRNIHRFSNFQAAVAPIAGGPVRAQAEALQVQLITPQIQPSNDTPSLIDWTPEQIRAYAELRKLKPAENQQDLPEILRQVGERVTAFFEDFPNATSTEDIQSGPCTVRGENCGVAFKAKFQYLLVGRQVEGQQVMTEYRANKKGRPVDYLSFQADRPHRYVPFLTSGFAVAPLLHFHPQNRLASRFRYFGRQKARGGSIDLVVGFAEIPGKYCCPTKFGAENREAEVFVQGLAWIDASTHQIVRIQTFLLAPRLDVGLERQTTRIEYSSVRLPEISTPFWLPTKVTVDIRLHQGPRRGRYRNIHRYSHYKLFRVETRINAGVEN